MTPGEESRPDLVAVLGELLGGKKPDGDPPGEAASGGGRADGPEGEDPAAPPEREEAERAPETSAEEKTEGEASPPGGLLSDPALLRALPVVLSLVSSLGGSPQKAAALPAAPKSEGEKRAALLRAVKPYLSPERADAVEIVLKVTELIDLLK